MTCIRAGSINSPVSANINVVMQRKSLVLTRPENLCNLTLGLSPGTAWLPDMTLMVAEPFHSRQSRASLVLRKSERIDEKRQCWPTKKATGQRRGNGVFELVRRHLSIRRPAWR